MLYVDQMFNIAASATALTLLNSGITAGTGPYLPPVSGRLIRVTILLAGQAASSLLEALRVDLTCTSWTPNTMRFGAAGGALRTAPAFPMGPWSWDVDEPVNTAQGIQGSYLFNVAAVTPQVQVFGTFSTTYAAVMPIPGA